LAFRAAWQSRPQPPRHDASAFDSLKQIERALVGASAAWCWCLRRRCLRHGQGGRGTIIRYMPGSVPSGIRRYRHLRACAGAYDALRLVMDSGMARRSRLMARLCRTTAFSAAAVWRVAFWSRHHVGDCGFMGRAGNKARVSAPYTAIIMLCARGVNLGWLMMFRFHGKGTPPHHGICSARFLFPQPDCWRCALCRRRAVGVWTRSTGIDANVLFTPDRLDRARLPYADPGRSGRPICLPETQSRLDVRPVSGWDEQDACKLVDGRSGG